VVGHAGRNPGVRKLHQKGSAAPEEEHSLAVDPADDGAIREQTSHEHRLRGETEVHRSGMKGRE